MKKFVIALTAIAGFAGSALAADLPARGPVMRAAVVPPPVMSWTSCYLGGGGGYGLWNQETYSLVAPGVVTSSTSTQGGRGYFATGQVGCDYQFMQNLVVGAFGDFDYSWMKGKFTVPNDVLGGDEKMRWSWAAGARLGFLPMQQLLAFFSAGYTQARFDSFSLATITVPQAATGYSIPAQTYNGWFLGSGYEYGISWLPGLFWKTEYRYAVYGADNLDLLLTGAPTTTSINSKKFIQTIRSELVWRFSSY